MSQTINAWADKYAVGPAALEALYATLERTPGARWREAGEPDPHGNQYDCERATLALGHVSDDELANAVFLHGNEQLTLEQMLDPRTTLPIAYLTAAKDRIRWLSRKLVDAEQLAVAAEDANTQLRVERDAQGGEGYVSAMGEAAENYHRSFKFAHPLPAQWRWEDVWVAMSKATNIRDERSGGYVDPVTRHWPNVQVTGWTATTIEHLFAVLSQLSKTLKDCEGSQLLARVWRINSPVLRLISGNALAVTKQGCDLEQFRIAVQAYQYRQQEFGSVAGIAEGKRLMDLIDASAKGTSAEVGECNCPNGRADHMTDCASQTPALESWWTHTNGKRYQVKAIANTAHRHPNHPITVVYRGEYGHWWTRPLSDWHRSMKPEVL